MIVPVVRVTACPAVIETLSSTMSVPEVPTVNPEMTVVSSLSVTMALAAVPVASALLSEISGSKSNVRTPDAAVPQGPPVSALPAQYRWNCES